MRIQIDERYSYDTGDQYCSEHEKVVIQLDLENYSRDTEMNEQETYVAEERRICGCHEPVLRNEYRVEHDSMGEVKVPADSYWAALGAKSY